VLTPWLGEDRVSVQVTATLDDSETRQTVERVRNVVVGGETRPLEKTVRTTRVPEGRLQRVNAIVILGFDAGAADLRRAGQLARQALGLQPARGDTLSVYALPAAAVEAAQAELAAPPPQVQAPTSQAQAPTPIPRVRPVSPPPRNAPAFEIQPWMLAAAAIVLLVGAAGMRRRSRRAPADEVRADDFDAELEAVRGRVLADPRVTADVIKLWMRA
jgi:flagellar biosynthesis/type III secretory pathway M-ring protein FliF/YscJ